MSMRLDHIKVRSMRNVVMVADGMTVSQVAKRQNTSPAGISLAIQRTEAIVGEPIFTRGAHKITGVTESGRVVVEQFRTAIRALYSEEQEGSAHG